MAGGSAVTVSSPHISSGPLSYMHSTNDTLYTGSSVYTGSTALHLPHSYNMPQGSTIHRDNYNTNGMYAPTYQVHESVHKPRMISQLPPYTPSCSTASTHNTFVSSTSSHPKPHNPLQSYIPTSSSLQLLTISSPPSQVASCNLSATRTQVLQEEKDDGGVSRILDDLRKQVLLRKYESQRRPPSPSVSSDFVKAVKASASRHNDTSSIGDALSHLSLQSQEFAKNLAEMGFPLNRVARATQKFGTDEAKVIEFLLQVQSLEEKNYPEGQIEKALFIHHFKEDEATTYLENLNQIMKLGFKEEDVELALSKTSNNRDKALDILIS
uniref:UBA domain-containing protein n=2 Tax=Rhodnius prolixus TaxID=13249 RepID=T1I3C8_RHOPR